MAPIWLVYSICMDMLWGYGWRCLILFQPVRNAASTMSSRNSECRAQPPLSILFVLHRNHNERNRESCTIRHHHRSILYRIRRWNLSVCYFLQFDNMDTYDHVSALSLLYSGCCNTCAIFYYLDSSSSDTLNFRSSRKSSRVFLLTISRYVTT